MAGDPAASPMDMDTPPHVAAFAQYINTPARLARASATTNTTAATSVPALAASSVSAPASTPAPAQASYASASTAASAPGPALYAFERIHYGPASNPTWLAPTSSNALAPSPNQLAGQKRSRQDFEPQREVRRPVSPRDIPAYRVTSRQYPRESHLPPDVPAVRYVKRVGRTVCNVAWWTGKGLKNVFQFIKARYDARTAGPPSAIPAQHVAVVEVGHKRRAVAVMPGTYPDSPMGANAATTTPTKRSSPLKTSGNQDSPFTTASKVKATPKPLFPPHTIIAMPVSQATSSSATVKQSETSAISQVTNSTAQPTNSTAQTTSSTAQATSSNAHPTSSMAQPTSSMAPVKQPEMPAKKPETITPPASRPSSSDGPKAGPPAEQAPAQPKHTRPMRRSYKQPFNLEPYQPGPIKPILKKPTDEDRDAAVADLIQRSKNVTIESPEEKAVRHTYRARKHSEELKGWRQIITNRDIEEERIAREVEAKEQKERRAARAAREERERLWMEEQNRKLREWADEMQALESENERMKRLRIIAEEDEIAEDRAKRQREREARKQKAAAAAAERRATYGAKLATKTASEEEESPDEAERELKRQRQIIKTLSADWDEKIYQAMAVKNPNHTIAKSVEGAELSRKDFGTVLPQQGTNDAQNGWLNDEIVNGYIGSIVASKKEHTNYQKGKGAPAFESYPVAWYKTYKNNGIQGISRWSKRKGIKGAALLEAVHIYFPINDGAHWTLLIISPKDKTIEFLDSLPSKGRAREMFAIAREWLEMELGAQYKPEEWVDKASVSERQNNSNDCGVFTCFNALANAKGLPYNVVDAGRIPQARRMIAATLMAGGLNESMDLE